MSGLEGKCLSPRSPACGQPLPPEAQPGAPLSPPQQGGTQGEDTGKEPRQGPRWTRRPTPQPYRHMTDLDVAVGPHLVSTVNDPPEASVQIVSLFFQITQYKDETDASIGSSSQTRMQLKEHRSE